MTRRADPNPSYWEQYGPFQQVKHELIRCYLNGWYRGSPVLALQTLLRHSYRDTLLTASEFNFLFIERDPANLSALEAELSQLKPFPARVGLDNICAQLVGSTYMMADEARPHFLR